MRRQLFYDMNICDSLVAIFIKNTIINMTYVITRQSRAPPDGFAEGFAMRYK